MSGEAHLDGRGPAGAERGPGAAVIVLLSLSCLVVAATGIASLFFAGAISPAWLYPTVFWGITVIIVAPCAIALVLLPALWLRRKRRHPLLNAAIVICAVSLAVLAAQWLVLEIIGPRNL